MKTNKGFTLIELLVVIAIIGILASVILASLNSARGKARTANRLSDLNQIQTALEVYYNDNGSYPIAPPWRTACSGWTSVAANDMIPGLVPTYMPSLPTDPAMNAAGNQNCYLYLSNGDGYKLIDYNLTDMTAADIAHTGKFSDPVRNGGNQAICPGSSEPTRSLAIYTSGYACN